MFEFRSKLDRLKLLIRKIGLINAFLYIARLLILRAITIHDSGGNAFTINDVVSAYSYVYKPGNPKVLRAKSCAEKTINWIIPDFGIGSGGHLNIFRMISMLEKRKYRCNIIIDGPSQFKSGSDAKACIQRHFFPIDAEVGLSNESIEPAWATFATSWSTAYTVRNITVPTKKLYFVQDYEPYFYPKGSVYNFAEQTYNFGFDAITAGNWLAEILHRKHQMKTLPISFSFDKDLYKPKNDHKEKQRVLFYARPVTPRRGFELGLLVLNEVYKQKPNIEIVFVGWDCSAYKIGFPVSDLGVVKLDELPEIYSSCSLALVISFTNLSLLPIELMACGCVVVSNNGDNVEWLLNNKNAVVEEPSLEALSVAIIELLDDNKKLGDLRKAGLEFACSTDWEREGDKVDYFLSKL